MLCKSNLLGVFKSVYDLCTVGNISFFLTPFLTPAHKGWGYSRPLGRPGGGGGGSGHKACGCSTA